MPKYISKTNKDMANGMRDQSLPYPSDESSMLAKKAHRELEADSTTLVLCPKCQTRPTLTITPRGERSTVRCECGYIRNTEIHF